jgi:hypothetical protein
MLHVVCCWFRPTVMRSSQEERLSYEADQMLGSGEVIGKLQVSWDELLNHGERLVPHSCTYANIS